MSVSGKQSPKSPLPLDPETNRSVVEHMNSDHADACLTIVRAFGGQADAVIQAKLIDLDRQGLLFQIRTHAGHESANHESVRVDFLKPLRTEAQIRGALVGLTQQARRKLED